MRAGAWAAVVFALFSGSALADRVTLSAKIGDFSVSGDLRSFDGAYYRLLTDQGPVTLRAEAVDCVGMECPAAGETTGFRIAVAHDLADVLVPALVRAFAAAQGFSTDVEGAGPEVVFRLSRQGAQSGAFPIALRIMSASEAFADLAAQASDLAIIDRSISDAELAFMRDAGLGDLAQARQERLLALDGLAVAVSPQRSETDVSLEALSQALSKSDPQWSDLGGMDPSPLAVTLRAQGEDLPRLIELLGSVSAPVEYRVDANAVAQSLRSDPTRFGIVPASALGIARGLRLVEPCGLGHAPTSASLAMGRYPWVMPIKSYQPDIRPPRELREFMGFLSTDRAARVIERAGFARPSLTTVSDDLPERVLAGLRLVAPSELARFQALVARLSSARQIGLSIPVRTETGPMRGVQRLALQELARAVQTGQVSAEQILLVASGQDPATARLYAQDVLEQLFVLVAEPAADLQSIQIETHGALLPVACQGAPWADWMNARVDVWMLPNSTETPLPEN
ncbi:MAG: hypothetical protein QNI90_16070 [Dinoroseobacter sp.]|nr:hypothetical protein [Dinoroseobacter sp.]